MRHCVWSQKWQLNKIILVWQIMHRNVVKRHKPTADTCHKIYHTQPCATCCQEYHGTKPNFLSGWLLFNGLFFVLIYFCFRLYHDDVVIKHSYLFSAEMMDCIHIPLHRNVPNNLNWLLICLQLETILIKWHLCFCKLFIYCSIRFSCGASTLYLLHTTSFLLVVALVICILWSLCHKTIIKYLVSKLSIYYGHAIIYE